MTQLNSVQTILFFIVFVWIIAFGFATILQRPRQFMTWTGNTLQLAWRHGWQIIVGMVICYVLMAYDPFRLSIHF